MVNSYYSLFGCFPYSIMGILFIGNAASGFIADFFRLLSLTAFEDSPLKIFIFYGISSAFLAVTAVM